MPQIKTFCRVKPTEAIYEDHELTEDKIFLRVPEVLKDFNAARASSRSTINHEFRFDYIFKQDTTQEEVFDIAAQEIVKGASENILLVIFFQISTKSQGRIQDDF